MWPVCKHLRWQRKAIRLLMCTIIRMFLHTKKQFAFQLQLSVGLTQTTVTSLKNSWTTMLAEILSQVSWHKGLKYNWTRPEVHFILFHFIYRRGLGNIKPKGCNGLISLSEAENQKINPKWWIQYQMSPVIIYSYFCVETSYCC